MTELLRQIVASIGWNRLLIYILVALFAIVVLFYFPFLNSQFPSLTNNSATDKLKRDLETLKKQNLELQKIIKDNNLRRLQSSQKFNEDQSVDPEKGFVIEKYYPNSLYEITRRRVENGIKEWWYHSNYELKQLKSHINGAAPELTKTVNKILSLGVEHKGSLLHDIDFLSEVDGYAKWREEEAESLSNIVQERLKYLQNPTDCANARKVICDINKGCGFGCQLHHLVYCFIVGYATQRTFILKSKGWLYNEAGWETIFKPISDTCTDSSGKSVEDWSEHADAQVINLPVIDYIEPKPLFIPSAIPKDLAFRLVRLHGDPLAWWIGQFVKYLLRPQEATEKLITDAMKNTNFIKPTVGIHIRRSDKIAFEASFHSLEEYMNAVEDFYDILEMKDKDVVRRVYIASDDPSVFPEAREKYPNYQILGDLEVSNSATVENRYKENSLKGIILDIHFLSQCDYLVCTFSSHLCRVVYEIMQTIHPDASARFYSLDNIFYFGGQDPHFHVTVIPHKADNTTEIDLNVGDLVDVSQNFWNGYSKGRNMRTMELGLFPSFKIKNTIKTFDFPTYTEINGEHIS